MEIVKPSKMSHIAAAIELILEYVEKSPDLTIKCDAETYCEYLLKRFQDVGYTFRLALDGKTPIGFVSFSYDVIRQELWLEDLYVREPWRGKGTAKALIFSVIDMLVDETLATRLCFRTISLPQIMWIRLSKGIKVRTEKFGYVTREDYNSWKEV